MDYHNERLYWADAKLSIIGSIRLNGTDPIVAADGKRGERVLAALVPNVVTRLPAEPRDLTSLLTDFRSPAPSQPVGLHPPDHLVVLPMSSKLCGVSRAERTWQMRRGRADVSTDPRSLGVTSPFASGRDSSGYVKPEVPTLTGVLKTRSRAQVPVST